MAFPWRRGGGGEERTLAQVMASRSPEPSMIRPDAVRAAEAAAHQVALRVRPTREAERRRQDVVAYLQRLIGSTFGFEVFAFGSVPLKTYLPDGDADITVLANTWLNSSLIDDVRFLLKMEMENRDAEFQVTGVHFIDADVKLLKCVVDNIVVDISFNQIGGVSTFCFLEMVDRQVGKDHLFKRSIMLIKAWCYHESRILGAHHGLISTYAMETLVMYIFNLFHKSLHGPLEVLYRFLEYFSKFDWDKHGISLFGPVHLSSFPDLTIEPTVAPDELLISHEFLHGSLDRVVINGSNGHDTNFRLKFLNIIDPLKGNNNLGRSVNKANFYRIRSAFSLGAQKLGQILMLPSELVPGEICGFFSNTLKRHGNGERPNLGDYCASQSMFGTEDVPGDYNSFQSDMLDLYGDLDLNLACLRKVNYYIEYLLDELQQAIREAYLPDEIDENIFNVPTVELETRPQKITIASSTGTETKKLSPINCSHSTENVSHQSQVAGRADNVWKQNVPLSPNRLSISPSHASNSDMYPVAWVSVSPRSRGTGTYIPRVSYDMYKERMTPERGFMRRQRSRLAEYRRYNTLDPSYYSDPRNEPTAFQQSATGQLPAEEIKGSSSSSSSQDGHSSEKRDDPKQGAFLPSSSREQLTATCCGTNLQAASASSPKTGLSSEGILSCSSPSTDVSSSRDNDDAVDDEKERRRQVKPQSSSSHSRTSCQPSSPASCCSGRFKKVQAVEDIEFGSMGPLSLTLRSAQFEEAFPPLPSPVKKPAPAQQQVVVQPASSAVQSPDEPAVGTQSSSSRPQEAETYQLQDDAEFPPLKAAGC